MGGTPTFQPATNHGGAVELRRLGTAGAVASADFATKQKEKFGISDELVRQVGGMLQLGESAIFALMSTTTPAFVADHFARYGGRILRTTLKPDAAASVQQTIGA